MVSGRPPKTGYEVKTTGSTGGGDGTIVDGVDSNIKATVFDLTSSNPVAIAIVDSDGNQVSSFGGGTQYTEGDIDASPTGTAMMGRISGDDSLHVPILDANKYQMVNAGGGTIDAVTSITNPVAATQSGSWSVDVNSMPTTTVQATNLDIRDLSSATDSVSAVVTSSALPTGAATSAKQDTIIGHVDGIEGLLTTIDADTSTLAAVDFATGTDVASLATVGGGTEASALRVTIANDSTGVVSVDDNGGSITVDGAVNADLRVGGSAVTTSNPVPIQPPASGYLTENLGYVNGAAVNVGTGAISTGTQRVTLATDDPVSQGITSRYITGINHGSKTVATAGTDVALATSTACKRLIIQAYASNTGVIAFGASGVDAAAAGTGAVLSPGDSVDFYIDNLADVYIDSTVSGEGVRFTYWT